MKRIRIEPYRLYSRSARDLARGLGVLRLREQSRWRAREGDVVINWGCGVRRFTLPTYLNDPACVKLAIDKRLTYERLEDSDAHIPPWTRKKARAYDWLRDGHTVVARSTASGSQGRGITILEPGAEVPDAQLFSVYLKKKHEYRIHVFGGNIIARQHKRKRDGFEGVNNHIRNKKFGWVFCINDIVPPHQAVDNAALAAIEALELDFGAVDIGWNEHKQLASVYEVNTAPGLEGSTLNAYVQQLRTVMDSCTLQP